MQSRWTLAFLVVMNVFLQIFDGAATYVGWQEHGEMNPILSSGFDHFGAGPTLFMAKLIAIGFVMVLAATPRRALATFGLALTFTAYTAFSFVPWAQRLFG